MKQIILLAFLLITVGARAQTGSDTCHVGIYHCHEVTFDDNQDTAGLKLVPCGDYAYIEHLYIINNQDYYKGKIILYRKNKKKKK